MDETLLLFVLVGFVAQMVDGTLGMAYGVTSTTLLLSLGVTPVAASASVHTAEICTTLASGLAHLKFKNVQKELVIRLLLPGVLGGILGAYVLTSIDGNRLKPFIAVYLILMGIVILRKAFAEPQEIQARPHPILLGLTGGFCDAIGGGGWGPIVTTTLMARGLPPKFTIGSVNVAEFFVTVAEAATFFTILGVLQHTQIILGLMIGGVIAAPFAAYFCNKLPSRFLMISVGSLIVFLSLRTMYLCL